MQTNPEPNPRPPIKNHKAESSKGPEGVAMESGHKMIEINSETLKEAEKRGLDPEQWLDLLAMVKTIQHDNAIQWIDRFFTCSNGKIHVDGGLKFLHKKESLKRLPANLMVFGPLRIVDCSVEALPQGLQVSEDLWIIDCLIEEIPNTIKFGGPLLASHNKSLKRVPSNYPSNVSFAHCTALESLSDGFNCEGFVTLDHCPLKYLPKKMRARGLSVVGCPLADLPSDLVVDGDLILSENVHPLVKKQAENLQAKGQIKGIRKK